MLPLFGQFHRDLVAQSKVTPTFFLNYEQLILEPEPTIMKLFCFLLGVKSLEGTLVEAQIKKVTNKGHSSTSNQVYKLKADTGRLCARKHLYTAEQLTEIDTQLRDYMHFWGYAKHPDPAMESPTQFANYANQTEEELSNYKQFTELNDIRINEEL